MLGCVALTLGLQAFWLEPASLHTSEERVSFGGRHGPFESRSSPTCTLALHSMESPTFAGSSISRMRRVPNDLASWAIAIQGVLGGRFVSPEDIARELARLRSGVGTFAVLGNHDGWLDRDRVRTALAVNGVRIVEDTAVRVDTPAGAVFVAGVSDLWTGPHDLATALSAVTGDAEPGPPLTHNPDVFPMVPDRVARRLRGTPTAASTSAWIGKTRSSRSFRTALCRRSCHRRRPASVRGNRRGHKHHSGPVPRIAGSDDSPS